jgi:hypothetical protein
MRVLDVQIVVLPDACELRARVESDSHPDDDGWVEPFTLWYRFPSWCRAFLSVDRGDPFLAALLVPAMRLGGPLSLPAPISPRLRGALPEIQAIYAAFDPRTQIIEVEVSGRNTPLAECEGVRRIGLFFSMGVDSFYSLLKNLRDHPSDERTITHLISVHGFDVAHDGWNPVFPPQLLEKFTYVAEQTHTTLVPVVTNVREVGARLAPWTMMHGGAIASVALALGSAFQQVTIAASATYATLVPWGTHPLLDPLWSTETLTVVHDGCEMDTIDKTRYVARSPLVMETLRVCPGYGPGYNCGRCMKCLRTMIDLLQDGSLARCQTLPREIDAEALRAALRMPAGAIHIANFRRRQETFAASGERPDLNQVLIEHLAEVGSQASPHPRRHHLWPWRHH